jgi:CBS domain-containing protein
MTARSALIGTREPGGSVGSAVVADAMISAPKLCRATATVEQVRQLFQDAHVHAALLVDDGILLAVVERRDLVSAHDGGEAALGRGSVRDRVVRPGQPLVRTWVQMVTSGQRRLAVVDADDRLLGLLCLKRSGTGFCSDRDVRARRVDQANGA